MNPKPQWRFRAMQPGEMNVDPIEGEFFTTEALRSVTDALVRESIQNSLDASAGGDPVTVRFSHHQNPGAGIDPEELQKLYIDGLSRIFMPSIQACRSASADRTHEFHGH
jgi:hypothetical protein